MTTNENRINVVKIGGAPGNSLEPLISEIARRSAAGERWVVAHGASGAMDALCRERGVEIRMVTSPSGYRSRFVGETERAQAIDGFVCPIHRMQSPVPDTT